MAARESASLRLARWPIRLLLVLCATCAYFVSKFHHAALHGSTVHHEHDVVDAPLLPKDLAKNPTRGIEQTAVFRPYSGVVIDILSIGSTSRMENLQAQKDTFGTHVSVRHFFNATEADDADPDCASKLSEQDVYEISNWCRDEVQGKKWDPTRQFVMSYWKAPYANTQWLSKKKNPQGWMCAQTRPAQAFYNTLKQNYASGATPLPDYLLIVDDDTYYNMEILVDNLAKDWYKNSSIPIAMAGCLVRSPITDVNLTIPFGGYGLTLSKGYLQSVMKPIRCADSPELCHSIQTISHIDEGPLFRENITIARLMYKYATKQPYVKYRKWKAGFCLHSDWLWSIFTNFYGITRHNVRNLPFFDTVPQERMEAYLDSELYVGNPNRKSKGTCDFSGDYCHSFAPVCHYTSPKTMQVLHDLTKQRHPGRFRESLQIPETNSPNLVIDILLLESSSNQTTLDAHRNLVEKRASVRNFDRISVAGISDRDCTTTLSAQGARDIITKCSTRQYSPQQALLKQTQGFFARKEVEDEVRWICRQILPLAGLAQMLRRYVDEPFPDYLLLLREGTYYNFGILEEDLLRRPDRPAWVKTSSTEAWAMSGCIRSNGRMPFKYPLIGFGLLLSKGILTRLNEPLHCHGEPQSDPEFKRWVDLACRRIEENRIGEKAQFRDGTSLAKLLYSVAAEMPMNGEVPFGLCLRDDWWFGYLIETYNVTDDSIQVYAKSIHSGIKKVGGLCNHIGDIKCNPAAPYCQKISAGAMQQYANAVRS